MPYLPDSLLHLVADLAPLSLVERLTELPTDPCGLTRWRARVDRCQGSRKRRGHQGEQFADHVDDVLRGKSDAGAATSSQTKESDVFR